MGRVIQRCDIEATLRIGRTKNAMEVIAIITTEGGKTVIQPQIIIELRLIEIDTMMTIHGDVVVTRVNGIGHRTKTKVDEIAPEVATGNIGEAISIEIAYGAVVNIVVIVMMIISAGDRKRESVAVPRRNIRVLRSHVPVLAAEGPPEAQRVREACCKRI